MNLRESGFLMVLLASVPNLITGQTIDPIPRNTSYTLWNTYLKICNAYPFVESVKEFKYPGLREVRDIAYKRSGSR